MVNPPNYPGRGVLHPIKWGDAIVKEALCDVELTIAYSRLCVNALGAVRE